MSRKAKKDWDLDTLLSIVGFVFELVRVVVNALRKRGGNVNHLRRLLKEPDLVDQVFELIVVPGMADKSAPIGFETVTVPADATAEGLIAQAKAAFKKANIPFTSFDDDLIQLVRQDLELVRGKTCQVKARNFGHDWGIAECRETQKEGFDGNAAAQIVWVIEKMPIGWFVSIANDDSRLYRSPGSGLYAPYFGRGDDGRKFYLSDVRDRWAAGISSVSFRAI